MPALAQLSESEFASVVRAYELYDHQPMLIAHCEFDKRTSSMSLANMRRSIRTRKKLPTAEPAKLRIETDPAAVAAEIVAFIATAGRTLAKMPSVLREYIPTVQTERIDPVHPELLQLERRLQAKMQENNDLAAKLKAAHREGTLFLECADAIRESTLPLRPVNPRKKGVDTGEFDMVLILSDEHADQMVTASGTWGLEQYDFNIFRCRMERLLEQTIAYATVHLPKHKFGRLWILKLGDAVNGDIHGAGSKNFFQNTIKASISTGDVEAQFVQALVPYFAGGVHVIAVSGNHPRRSMRKDYGGPQDNFDYLVVTQMATRLAGEIAAGNVTVNAPNAWTAFVEIRNKLWCLNHGDDVKGFAGHPWYGFDRKNNKVQSMVSRFDTQISFFCYGHYHTAIQYPSAGAMSLHSGAWPMTDPFAINAITAGNEPVQTLYVIGDDPGIVLTIPIYTRDLKREQAFREGEWQPILGNDPLVDKISEQPHGFAVIKP